MINTGITSEMQVSRIRLMTCGSGSSGMLYSTTYDFPVQDVEENQHIQGAVKYAPDRMLISKRMRVSLETLGVHAARRYLLHRRRCDQSCRKEMKSEMAVCGRDE